MHVAPEMTFKALVAFAEDLKRSGLLNAGYVFFVNRDDQVELRPLSWEEAGLDFDRVKEMGLTPDDAMPSLANNLLKAFDASRYEIARSVDIDSKTWNSSPIGRVLDTISTDLREQVNYMLDYRDGKPNAQPYNLPKSIYLARQLFELATKMNSEYFNNSSQLRRFVLLNAWGIQVNEDYQNYLRTQFSDMVLEMIIQHGQLKQRGVDISDFIARTAQPSLEILQKRMNEAQIQKLRLH
jgi:hypothetical protein